MYRKTFGTILAAVALATPAAFLASATASTPHGSHAEVILETHDVTGQPWNASLAGWWGHEGASTDKGKRPTIVSLDMSNGKGLVDGATTAALHKALDDGGDFSSLRVAFVPYSADGSNEHPTVHKGENAGQAFKWFADLGVGTALNGNSNKNDFVSWVSTLDEYTKWWNAGRPLQGFDDKLNVLDIGSSGTTTPSAAPEGKSILDRWPAGTKVSLVLYVADGVDKAMPQVPTVKVGRDGKAQTAWLTFQTVASPDDSARTSGGYKVLTGAGTGPGVAAKPIKAPAGTSADGNGTAQAGAGSTASGATGSAASGSGSGSGSGAGSKKSHGLFGDVADALPGGQPTFWVLLVLLVVGGGAFVTARMRGSETAGGPAEQRAPVQTGAPSQDTVGASRDTAGQ